VAVAAPTAGLHFTQNTLSNLNTLGILCHDLTLNVGLDTFQPIRSENIKAHLIHKEFYQIPCETVDALIEEQAGPRVAVGTTSLRVMEDFLRKRTAESAPISGLRSAVHYDTAELFIYPPDRILSTDILITNFHLPRSTLMCLVAAFLTPDKISGIKWLKEIYREAIGLNYRFYSYGDAMLIL